MAGACGPHGGDASEGAGRVPQRRRPALAGLAGTFSHRRQPGRRPNILATDAECALSRLRHIAAPGHRVSRGLDQRAALHGAAPLDTHLALRGKRCLAAGPAGWPGGLAAPAGTARRRFAGTSVRGRGSKGRRRHPESCTLLSPCPAGTCREGHPSPRARRAERGELTSQAHDVGERGAVTARPGVGNYCRISVRRSDGAAPRLNPLSPGRHLPRPRTGSMGGTDHEKLRRA